MERIYLDFEQWVKAASLLPPGVVSFSMCSWVPNTPLPAQIWQRAPISSLFHNLQNSQNYLTSLFSSTESSFSLIRNRQRQRTCFHQSPTWAENKCNLDTFIYNVSVSGTLWGSYCALMPKYLERFSALMVTRLHALAPPIDLCWRPLRKSLCLRHP